MHLPEIDALLNSFVPVTLEEMDEVMLMNRQETKYVFSAGRIPALLEILSASYKVLEIGKVRSMAYNTTYYDTPDMFFYTEQVRGKLNRHKLRYRNYESTGDSFLEIKKKTNKNRTIKWRIANCQIADSFDMEASEFIHDYLPYDSLELNPVLINCFNRITLVGKEVMERITLDYGISFNIPGETASEFPFLAIAEIKRDKSAGFSLVGNSMKHYGIPPTRFSKYCMGSALVRELPRKNTLKRKLLLLNKIENEYIKYA